MADQNRPRCSTGHPKGGGLQLLAFIVQGVGIGEITLRELANARAGFDCRQHEKLAIPEDELRITPGRVQDLAGSLLEIACL
jgi:hypothetical protein